MDDHIRKLDTKSRVRKPSLMHYTLKSKNWKKRLRHYTTVEMSLTGVLGAIFETEEEEE